MKGLMLILLILLISGCVEEGIIPTTTTIIPTTSTIQTTTTFEETTTTLEEPTTTTIIEEINATTTTISRRCKFLNFQIKSHLYRNDIFTFYFENLGSETINDFDIYLYFDNKTQVEEFRNQEIGYKAIEKYVMGIGPGLDNVTVVDTDCGKSYFINV